MPVCPSEARQRILAEYEAIEVEDEADAALVGWGAVGAPALRALLSAGRPPSAG
jgi:pyruvate/2-oxoacid:ferredoxin oxidoreductase alpha subunit